MTDSTNGSTSLRTTADNGGQGDLLLEFFIYDYLDIPYFKDGFGMIAMVRNSFPSIEQGMYHFSSFSSFTTIPKYHKLTLMVLASLPTANIQCNFQRKQYHFSVRHTPIALQPFELICKQCLKTFTLVHNTSIQDKYV
jgi:hypothetical protein